MKASQASSISSELRIGLSVNSVQGVGHILSCQALAVLGWKQWTRFVAVHVVSAALCGHTHHLTAFPPKLDLTNEEARCARVSDPARRLTEGLRA